MTHEDMQDEEMQRRRNGDTKKCVTIICAYEEMRDEKMRYEKMRRRRLADEEMRTKICATKKCGTKIGHGIEGKVSLHFAHNESWYSHHVTHVLWGIFRRRIRW